MRLGKDVSAVVSIGRFKSLQSSDMPVLRLDSVAKAHGQRMVEATEAMCDALGEASEREETMIRELARMRQAIVRADERGAVAVERAEAAEARARSSERRERITVTLGAIGAIAAVVAIFVAG